MQHVHPGFDMSRVARFGGGIGGRPAVGEFIIDLFMAELSSICVALSSSYSARLEPVHIDYVTA